MAVGVVHSLRGHMTVTTGSGVIMMYEVDHHLTEMGTKWTMVVMPTITEDHPLPEFKVHHTTPHTYTSVNLDLCISTQWEIVTISHHLLAPMGTIEGSAHLL